MQVVNILCQTSLGVKKPSFFQEGSYGI